MEQLHHLRSGTTQVRELRGGISRIAGAISEDGKRNIRRMRSHIITRKRNISSMVWNIRKWKNSKPISMDWSLNNFNNMNKMNIIKIIEREFRASALSSPLRLGPTGIGRLRTHSKNAQAIFPLVLNQKIAAKKSPTESISSGLSPSTVGTKTGVSRGSSSAISTSPALSISIFTSFSPDSSKSISLHESIQGRLKPVELAVKLTRPRRSKPTPSSDGTQIIRIERSKRQWLGQH
jgi:hypothetical protein